MRAAHGEFGEGFHRLISTKGVERRRAEGVEGAVATECGDDVAFDVDVARRRRGWRRVARHGVGRDSSGTRRESERRAEVRRRWRQLLHEYSYYNNNSERRTRAFTR